VIEIAKTVLIVSNRPNQRYKKSSIYKTHVYLVLW